MKTVIALIFLSLCVFIGCGRASKSNFEDIRLGSSKDDVESELGTSDNNDGIYDRPEFQIQIIYSEGDKVVGKLYLVKDPSSEEESIIEGELTLIYPINFRGNGYYPPTFKINDIRIVSDDYSAFSSKPGFISITNYRVTGVFDFQQMEIKTKTIKMLEKPKKW